MFILKSSYSGVTCYIINSEEITILKIKIKFSLVLGIILASKNLAVFKTNFNSKYFL